MPDLDLAQIQTRQSAAHAHLEGGYGDDLNRSEDTERADRELTQLVDEDVPAMLLELESRANAIDIGYVRGLRAAASWLRAWDQNLPGFDRDTCRQLAKGMAGMAASAQERLGVDPDQPDEREIIAADTATLQEAGR